jgi:hypothetical protein
MPFALTLAASLKARLGLIMLGCLLATGQLSAQVNISSGGIVTENFDGLGSVSVTWVDNSTLPGWYAALTNTSGAVSPYTGTCTATTGSGSTSTILYSFGSSGSTERSLGGAGVTATKWMLGWRLVNAGASTITNLTLSYEGEQWKNDGLGTNTVSYQIFSAGGGNLSTLGGWTAAPESLTFTCPFGGGTGAVNGNSTTNRQFRIATLTGLNLPVGGEIWFKWTIAKKSGSNVGQGVDNAQVAANLGAAPTISAIPSITVMAGQTSTNADFTVSDPEDGAPTATPTVVSSSNENIVPSSSVLFGGSGANRFVYVSPAGVAGTAVIAIQIVDSAGNPAQQTFTATVLPLDYPPSISTPAPTNMLVNTSVTVPFTVGDTETPATSLVVTGQVATYSMNILTNLVFGGSGSNRTVAVDSVPGADGVGVVNLSVTDSNNVTVTNSFAVMVRAAANVAFIEHFDYPVNSKLFNFSGGLWVRRNTSAGDINLLTAPNVAAGYVRPKNSADDGAAHLVGAPFRPGTGVQLYTMFNATWVDLGAADVLVTNSNGGFVHLANNSSATSTQFAKVATTTNNTPDSTFRLALYDLNSQYQPNTVVDIPEPMPSSGPYTVVVRYDVDSAQSTLWVNATSESDPSATSQDQTTPENINYIGLRQDLGFGYIYVDDLKVVVAVKPVITSITPPAGGNLDLYFTASGGDAASGFGVVRASTVTGTYGDVSATVTAVGTGTFKATVAASPGYYRIKRLPLTF